MRPLIDIKKFRFYLWVGLAYFLVRALSNIVDHPDEAVVRSVNTAWLTVYVIILNFALFEYSWPYIRQARQRMLFRIVMGLLLLWIYIMLYSFGLYAWRAIGIQLHIYTALKTYSSVEEGVTAHFPYSIASLFFFGIIRHIYNYIKLKQSARKLRIEKQEAELNYLKSQTNPHFLFNTLNNIYSLARDKSDLAAESVLRLSKILRFMLYEAGGEYISIEQELKIISDYIELEKLRYDDSLRINFNYDIEDMKQALPPLLLIPLVENAFKHGVSETRHRPFVDIHLSVNKRQLKYQVKNSTDVLISDRGVKENIGLSNLRRQLELLYTEYDLSVQQGDSTFTAVLKINLASHV
jgi:two-component system, LytTR family, sensor kinase